MGKLLHLEKITPVSLVILMEEGFELGKGEKALSNVGLVGTSRDSRQLLCAISDQLVGLCSYENLHHPRALCLKLGSFSLG